MLKASGTIRAVLTKSPARAVVCSVFAKPMLIHSFSTLKPAITSNHLKFACANLPKQAQFSYTTSASRLVEAPARVIEYPGVKALSESNDPNVVIVDAREPDEYKAGHIPHAVNIPYNSMPGALGLDSAEFESTLGFPKPSVDKTLVFYCHSGIRSTNSEQLASTYGYTKRLNYKGSYEDWVQKEAKETKKAKETATGGKE